MAREGRAENNWISSGLDSRRWRVGSNNRGRAKKLVDVEKRKVCNGATNRTTRQEIKRVDLKD